MENNIRNMSTEIRSMTQPLFIAFGNPLMDISVKINDTSILEKYELEQDGQIELEPDRMNALLEDISLRLQMHPTLPSGRCVCLYQGDHRSLVANIGAAAYFSVDLLASSLEDQKLLDEASMVFIEGFFLQNRFPVCQYIVEDVQKKRNKILAYNLGATYVIETLTEESKFVAENADVVFGNTKEFTKLGQLCYDLMTAEECAVFLHKKWKETYDVASRSKGLYSNEQEYTGERTRFGKILVVTDGAKRILIVHGTLETCMQWIDVPKLPTEQIVDTTGAGDFFAAGFCWGIMKGQSPKACAKFGCRLSAMNVVNVGVIVPDQPPPVIEDIVDLEDDD